MNILTVLSPQAAVWPEWHLSVPRMGKSPGCPGHLMVDVTLGHSSAQGAGNPSFRLIKGAFTAWLVYVCSVLNKNRLINMLITFTASSFLRSLLHFINSNE